MSNPKIQLRHDTASNWSTVNPILLDGEVALVAEQQIVNIPTTAFTSASTDGWVATCNNYSQEWSTEWYKVFDSTVSRGWYEGNSFGNPAWVQLMFPEELTLTKITLEQNGVSNCLAGNGYVSVIYSDSTMEQVGTFSMDSTVSKEYTVQFSEAKTCVGIRITITSILVSNGAGISTVRLYGNPINIYKDMKIGNGTTPYNSLPSTISIIDTLKSFAGYTDNGTRALQVINGVFTWVNI